MTTATLHPRRRATGRRAASFGRASHATCLEYDAIDGVRLPPQLAVGERLLITGLGSYDRTIAFDFGHGDGVPSV